MAGSGRKQEISALPEELDAAAEAFLTLVNVCDYLVGSWIIQGGWTEEYLAMNLGTNKPKLDSAWQDTMHEITGILLSAEAQFGDAAADLAMVADGFKKADG